MLGGRPGPRAFLARPCLRVPEPHRHLRRPRPPRRHPGYNDKTEIEWLRELTRDAVDDFETFIDKGLARLSAPDDAVAFTREIREPDRYKFATPSGKIEVYSMALAASAMRFLARSQLSA